MRITSLLGSAAALLFGIGAGSADARIQDALIGHAPSHTDVGCFSHSTASGAAGLINTCGTATTTTLWDMALSWDGPNPFSAPTVTGKANSGAAKITCTHTVYNATGTLVGTGAFPAIPSDGGYHTVTAASTSVGVNQTSIVRCSVPGGSAARLLAVNY